MASAMNVRLNKAQVKSGGARRALTCAALLLAQLTIAAHAGPNEQAKRIYERIAGEPPPAAVLAQMATAISGSPGQAGLLAAAARRGGAIARRVHRPRFCRPRCAFMCASLRYADFPPPVNVT